jgi:hypothetical protein
VNGAAWSAVALVLVLALVAGFLVAGDRALEEGASMRAPGEREQMAETPLPQATRPVLVAPPAAAPRVAPAAQAPERRLDEEQRLVLEEWERNAARDAALVSAGLLSADEADAERLAGLVERRVVGELGDAEFHRARAEIHARRLARREALSAAGLVEEAAVRVSRLDLAAARAESEGETVAYGVAWREHLRWMEERTSRAREAGHLGEAEARERVARFLLAWPWPEGTAEQAERDFAPYLTPGWGWVEALESAHGAVVRVHVRFGGAPLPKTGRRLRLSRGVLPVAEVEVTRVDERARGVVADVVSSIPGGAPRVGDVTTTD